MPGKIPQHVALYIPPRFISHEATCEGCHFFAREGKRCGIINPTEGIVNPTDGCGLYVIGTPHEHNQDAMLSRSVAGFDNGPFTCKRCKYNLIRPGLNAGECKKIEGTIERDGCCNGWEKERRQSRIMGGDVDDTAS